ncbi:NHL repeat-containing protein [Leptospira kanakyensis]|uniref:NHL repeat-containing protein n=1 Tax=Leptospira kanakyensis TaxID=2484968 RepID=UPI00223D4538|nr:NHL repeat-containing protein [Leptospira kanakyensis]MCW7468809.1 NHL repeat-containing protein [Leptospira kanakyensis]
MKIIRKILAITLPIFIFLTIGCKPKDLGNNCDPKSDSYFETLVFQALSTAVSYHCGFNLVNIPPFGYRHSNYRLYLDFPVSIVPRHPMNSSYSIQGVLPAGLAFDTTTGEINGTTKAITAPTNLTITKNSPGFGVVTITLQVVDTNPTMVYGQYGSFTCSVGYNNGSCVGGSVSNQNLSFPYGVANDSFGGTYISGVNRIQYYPPNSTASTIVYGQYGNFNCDAVNIISGTCTASTTSAGSLSTPRGITIDRENGLYTVDLGNQRILYYPYNNTTPTRVYGQPGYTTSGTGTSETTFSNPRAVALAPDGGLYTAESSNNRVLYFPPGSTTATRVYGQDNFSSVLSGTSETRLNGPFGLVVDSAGGLYVADSTNNRVLYFPVGSTTASRVYGQTSFSGLTPGSASSNLNGPTWLALDQSENLYVSDSTNNRVFVFQKSTNTSGHVAVAVFGQHNNLNCAVQNNTGGCTGGTVNALGLFAPAGISFNEQGQLYISDQTNNRVLIY